MKRNELKTIIKPIVKECIMEVLIQEGILSNVVSEVAKGLSVPVLREARVQEDIPRQKDTSMTKKISESRKKLMDAIGKDAFKGVDIFEGVTPIKESKQSMQADPLGETDPNDAGVDISSIIGMSSAIFKQINNKK